MNINIIIKHRINCKKDLEAVDSNLGIEVDLRVHENEIILNHDAFINGERIEDFLCLYKHSCIILNTKVDGIEFQLIEIMKRNNIEEYFFLDLSLPTMIKLIGRGVNKIAIRYSEFEPLEFVANFQGLVEWVWVDCFTKNVLTKDAYDYLHKHFKICIVSPELQGHPLAWIEDFKTSFEGHYIDAVCTKRPDLWK